MLNKVVETLISEIRTATEELGRIDDPAVFLTSMEHLCQTSRTLRFYLGPVQQVNEDDREQAADALQAIAEAASNREELARLLSESDQDLLEVYCQNIVDRAAILRPYAVAR